MGLRALQQSNVTIQLIGALQNIISRMAEFSTGVNGDISGVSGLLSQSDMSVEDKQILAQVGTACNAVSAAVARARLLVEAADVPGDMGTTAAQFNQVLAE